MKRIFEYICRKKKPARGSPLSYDLLLHEIRNVLVGTEVLLHVVFSRRNAVLLMDTRLMLPHT